MSEPIPVIVCGQNVATARAVQASLKPEYEVIHLILSPEEGVEDIPKLLRGEVPTSQNPDNIGTKDYSKRPAAIILGGAYDDAKVARLREAVGGASNIPWFMLDKTKPRAAPGPGYGAAQTQRMKAALEEIQREGKMNVDGVYLY